MGAVYERAVKLLRGEYNSVRYRYFMLPKEWLRYFLLYRLFGKDWTDFYTDRMNHEAALSRNQRPSERYLDAAGRHLDLLKREGLAPHHRFLDYGCGVMRTGRALIPYLEAGNYVGVDIAATRIDKGRELLAEMGMADSSYRAFPVTDCRLKELEGERFDFVWAQSVLTHMPLPEIRTMLRAMRPLLAPQGRFYFTFSEGESYRRRHVKDFWYPVDTMAAECAAAGYRFELVDYEDPPPTRMARLTVAEEEP
jgi:SAM-dependent methyltransferase